MEDGTRDRPAQREQGGDPKREALTHPPGGQGGEPIECRLAVLVILIWHLVSRSGDSPASCTRAPACGNTGWRPIPASSLGREGVDLMRCPVEGRRMLNLGMEGKTGRLVRRAIMVMDITSRMERMRTGARQRMMEMKADRAESQNEQLKAENRVLRDELEENRSERQRVLDLLERAEFAVAEPTKRRFRL